MWTKIIKHQKEARLLVVKSHTKVSSNNKDTQLQYKKLLVASRDVINTIIHTNNDIRVTRKGFHNLP